MRKGGSRNSLMRMYLDIICLNSGLEARAQSMQRVAPCPSVKQTDQVWCSSSSTGAPTPLNWSSSASSVSSVWSKASLGGTSLSDCEAKSALWISSARASSSVSLSLRMRLSTFSTKPRYSLSVPMKRVRSAPSMRLAASPWRTIMPSEARLTITFTNSRSSLMYCSKRPFLIL